MSIPTSQPKPRLAKALEQMTTALEILDEIGAPGEIGATLDLAIARLRQMLGRDGDSGMMALFSQLEDELSRIQGGFDTPPNPWEIPPV
jgi:hypothetical protein